MFPVIDNFPSLFTPLAVDSNKLVLFILLLNLAARRIVGFAFPRAEQKITNLPLQQCLAVAVFLSYSENSSSCSYCESVPSKQQPPTVISSKQHPKQLWQRAEGSTESNSVRQQQAAMRKRGSSDWHNKQKLNRKTAARTTDAMIPGRENKKVNKFSDKFPINLTVEI